MTIIYDKYSPHSSQHGHKSDLAVNHFQFESIQSPRVLLIENDQCLSNILKQQMHANGYIVQQQTFTQNMEKTLSNNTFNLVIIDLGFSDLPRLSIIEEIRQYFDGSLVLLTSRSSEREQITAFNLGIDEYLVKPISAGIFSVRIAALLRRSLEKKSSEGNKEIKVGNLTLRPASFKCFVDQILVNLTQFEFKLLHLLAENQGKIMSRDYIYQTLLGRVYKGSERTVDVRVSQLRDKLASKQLKNISIETVWGQGYMLTLT